MVGGVGDVGMLDDVAGGDPLAICRQGRTHSRAGRADPPPARKAGFVRMPVAKRVDVAGVEHGLDGAPLIRPPLSQTNGRSRSGSRPTSSSAPGASVLKSPASTCGPS